MSSSSWHEHRCQLRPPALEQQDDDVILAHWLAAVRIALSFCDSDFDASTADAKDLTVVIAKHHQRRHQEHLQVPAEPFEHVWTVGSSVDLHASFQRILEETSQLLSPFACVNGSIGRNATAAIQTVLFVDPMQHDNALEDFQSAMHWPNALPRLCIRVQNASQRVSNCVIHYSAEELTRRHIETMADCIQQVFAAITQDPAATLSVPVSSLVLIPQPLLNQVKHWSYPAQVRQGYQPSLMHSAFLSHAASQPDKVAVVYGTQSMTYDALRRASNRLAGLLQSLGISRDSRVGLLLNRSCFVVLCELSVLRAGGAFVPIAVDYPRDRVLDVVQDADIKVLLSVSWLTHVVQALELEETAVQVVYADMDPRLELFDAANDVVSNVEVNDLAYVIYTSGTTGRPKGVMIEHRNVSAFVQSYVQALGLTRDDVFSCLHEYTFDFNVSDIWMCLSVGGLLVGFSRDQLLSMEDFYDDLRRHRISYLSVTPGFFVAFAAYDLYRTDVLHSLKHLDFGGDALKYDMIPKWLRKYADNPPLVTNGYGPTETAIGCALDVFDEALAASPSGSRIGRPLPLYQLYVVNKFGMLLPPGMPGELWIGGEGVCRGYLNRAALTREKFMQNPFDHALDGRVYKSGDLCCWNADGSLAFFGRIDHQVKLHGFRIELGEIESVMRQLPGVLDSVACVLSADGNAHLMGYVVPAKVNTEVVLAKCRAHLPPHMVPSGVVALDAIPLTPNGKLDRRALPDLASLASKPLPRQLPATHAEQLVVEFTAKELQLQQRFDLSHSFVALGGSSLAAVRVAVQLHKCGFNISGASILRCKSLKELAQLIELVCDDPEQHQQDHTHESIPVSQLRANGLDRVLEKPLVVSFGQEMFLREREFNAGEDGNYNIGQLLRICGPFDVNSFRKALEMVIQRHESLRTTYLLQDKLVFKQVIHATLELDFCVDTDSFVGREEKSVDVMQRQVAQPMDIYHRGPVQVLVHRVGEHVHQVLINIHHTTYDGFSGRILWEELWACYEHFTTATGDDLSTLHLPAVPIQFYDFAVWQHSQLAKGTWCKHEVYWKEKLGHVPLMNLPYKSNRRHDFHERCHTDVDSGVHFAIPSSSVQVLQEIAMAKGLTRFTAMVTLVKMVLALITGQKEITLGVVTAARERHNLARCMGFLVNGLTLFTEIDLRTGFDEILSQVATTVNEALAHQEYPLLLAMKALKIKRMADLTQCYLLYQDGIQTEKLELGPLSIEEVPVAGTVVPMFDLMLEMVPQSDGSVDCALGYNTSLFDVETIDAIAHCFALITAQIVQQTAMTLRPSISLPLSPCADLLSVGSALLPVKNRERVAFALPGIHELPRLTTWLGENLEQVLFPLDYFHNGSELDELDAVIQHTNAKALAHVIRRVLMEKSSPHDFSLLAHAKEGNLVDLMISELDRLDMQAHHVMYIATTGFPPHSDSSRMHRYSYKTEAPSRVQYLFVETMDFEPKALAKVTSKPRAKVEMDPMVISTQPHMNLSGTFASSA